MTHTSESSSFPTQIRAVATRSATTTLALLLLMHGGSADDASYVGSSRCGECHQAEFARWQGSHHELAMADANEQTVLGDFDNASITAGGVTSRFFRRDGEFHVETDGPDGELRTYPIRYTFGWEPLQQYLVEFPRGHVQTLGLAWDNRPERDGGERWFHLYPDDPPRPGDSLHWTGRDQTWNYQCAECHSTGLAKNYDLATDSYRTTWSEISVGCESCHGPGTAHVLWAEGNRSGGAGGTGPIDGLQIHLSSTSSGVWGTDAASGKPVRSPPRSDTAEIDTCARCHSRRGRISDSYRHGAPLHDSHRLALLEEALYFPDGQIKDEVYVYGSFIQSRMYAAGVTCSDCHEPHSLQLRAAGNAVCTGCHTSERYDTSAHHHHREASPGAACTACHMPERTYMVIDQRADHSLRIPRPDLSVTLGTPNACNGCHANQSDAWAAQRVKSWFPAPPPPHFGETLHAAQTDAPGADEQLLNLAGDTRQPVIARATAIELLAARPSPGDLFTLQRLLGDPDAVVRGAAVGWFESVDLPARADVLFPLLSDPARSVRIETGRVLAPLLRQPLPDPIREELANAVREYLEAQAANADRPEAHLNIGLAAVAQGDARSAETAYRTALRLQPDFVPAYANLADLYRMLGDEKASEEVIGQGLQTAPDDAALHHALGLLRVRQGDTVGAVESLTRAAELAPANARYAYVHAVALHSTGNTQEALVALETALERHPGDPDILMSLTTMHRDRGDTESAREYARRLQKVSPDDPAVQALWQELQ